MNGQQCFELHEATGMPWAHRTRGRPQGGPLEQLLFGDRRRGRSRCLRTTLPLLYLLNLLQQSRPAARCPRLLRDQLLHRTKALQQPDLLLGRNLQALVAHLLAQCVELGHLFCSDVLGDRRCRKEHQDGRAGYSVHGRSYFDAPSDASTIMIAAMPSLSARSRTSAGTSASEAVLVRTRTCCLVSPACIDMRR